MQSRKNLSTLSATLLLLVPNAVSRGATGGATAPPSSGDVVMVVNEKTPVDNISLDDLRKILLGDRQFWSAGQRIVLLVRAPVAHERDVLLKNVCRMSEARFRQHWVAKVFRADAASGPKVVYSNQTALDLISNLSGAVGFVAQSEVPKGAKIVKINGVAPGEKGYPLQ